MLAMYAALPSYGIDVHGLGGLGAGDDPDLEAIMAMVPAADGGDMKDVSDGLISLKELGIGCGTNRFRDILGSIADDLEREMVSDEIRITSIITSIAENQSRRVDDRSNRTVEMIAETGEEANEETITMETFDVSGVASPLKYSSLEVDEKRDELDSISEDALDRRKKEDKTSKEQENETTFSTSPGGKEERTLDISTSDVVISGDDETKTQEKTEATKITKAPLESSGPTYSSGFETDILEVNKDPEDFGAGKKETTVKEADIKVGSAADDDESGDRRQGAFLLEPIKDNRDPRWNGKQGLLCLLCPCSFY